MNLFAASSLLIILPFISQLVIGSGVITKRVKLNFYSICLINKYSFTISIHLNSFEAYRN